MNHTTTKKAGRIPARVFLQVRACALIEQTAHAERIAAIAESKEVSADKAALIWTLGKPKRFMRLGLARTYAQAVELLEERQAGYAHSPLMRTVSADKTAREIARINAVNKQGKTAVLREGFTVDSTGTAVSSLFVCGFMAGDKPQRLYDTEAYRQTKAAKVLGAMYTQWEERAENSSLESEFNNKHRAANLKRYFQEYKARLSRIQQNNLVELSNYAGKPECLTSNAARLDELTSRLYSIAKNLFAGFPHKDSITRPMFVELVQKYING